MAAEAALVACEAALCEASEAATAACPAKSARCLHHPSRSGAPPSSVLQLKRRGYPPWRAAMQPEML